MPPDNQTENSQQTEMPTAEHSDDIHQQQPPITAHKLLRKRNLLIAAIIGANLAMSATALAVLSSKDKSQQMATKITTTAPSTTQKTIAPQQNLSTAQDTPSAQLEHYKSDALKLEFDYPIDWHISSDSSNKYISISSPVADIVNSNGQTVKSRVDIELALKYDSSSLVDDTMTTVAASEPLNYSNPTSVQRKSTNISFVSNDSNSTAIDLMFVSGNLVYAKGQNVSAKNYKAINPFIVIYSDGCPNGGCQALSVNALSLDTYHSNALVAKAKQIIQSMRFN